MLVASTSVLQIASLCMTMMIRCSSYDESCRSFIKSEAVLRIMEYLNLPFPQLAVFLKFVPL
jgi:hypothetical protein